MYALFGFDKNTPMENRHILLGFVPVDYCHTEHDMRSCQPHCVTFLGALPKKFSIYFFFTSYSSILYMFIYVFIYWTLQYEDPSYKFPIYQI